MPPVCHAPKATLRHIGYCQRRARLQRRDVDACSLCFMITLIRSHVTAIRALCRAPRGLMLMPRRARRAMPRSLFCRLCFRRAASPLSPRCLPPFERAEPQHAAEFFANALSDYCRYHAAAFTPRRLYACYHFSLLLFIIFASIAAYFSACFLYAAAIFR